MRPLFKKKAEQLRKVDPTKVEKKFIGGLMQGARAVAAPTFRYLAPKAQQFLARPGVQTGLAGLEGLGVYEGSKSMAEGIKTGDPYEAILGASMAVPGMAFLPGTAKRSGIGALRKFGEKVGEPMTGAGQFARSGKGQLTALGSGIGAMYLSPDQAAAAQQMKPEGMSQEQYAKDVQDRLIYSKPVYSDEIQDETAMGPTVLREKKAIGLKDPKTAGEKLLNKQLGEISKINNVAEKLGITNMKEASDQQLKQLAVESNVPIQNVRQYAGQRPQATEPPNPTMQNDSNTANMDNYSAGEVEALKNQRTKELASGKDAQKTSSLADGFAQFKEQMAALTGSGNDNLNNLIMMKAASALLTGKTRETGLSGLLDVGGRALGASADMMFQLALSQRNQDMKLAEAFLKYKAQKAKTGKVDIGKGDDITVRVNDPSAPGGFVNKRLSKGEDGKFYERRIVNGQQTFIPTTYTGTDVKQNSDKINFNASQLFENKRGGKMIDFVIDNAAEGGTKAAFGLLSERAFGTLDYLAGTSGGLQNSSSSIDALITEEMAKNTEKSLFGLGGEKGGKLIDQYNKDIQDATENGAKKVEKELKRAGIIAKDYRPSDEELNNYTKLALIEQRMKYIVANANKSEDRLTQKDIDNAAQRTQIIKFIASPREITKNYESLKQEFNEKAQSYLLQFKLNGGSEEFIQTNFMDIPGVKTAYGQSASEFATKQLTKNKPSNEQILSTIPITGTVK